MKTIELCLSLQIIEEWKYEHNQKHQKQMWKNLVPGTLFNNK